ncbi:hypothetical protein L1987_84092 [Smallanthus sonchifolius]|uniref:Uncharacterized protein n=1 Tax=Smallanthus sonchifolius TaxID=185202 RepID=A0ACB8YF82_9ASTR|nr:hypothetical protein L1987_84092 [Smallanthus sonchifolius]
MQVETILGNFCSLNQNGWHRIRVGTRNHQRVEGDTRRWQTGQCSQEAATSKVIDGKYGSGGADGSDPHEEHGESSYSEVDGVAWAYVGHSGLGFHFMCLDRS